MPTTTKGTPTTPMTMLMTTMGTHLHLLDSPLVVLLSQLLGHVVPVPGHRPVIISFLGEKQGNVLTMPGNRHLIISILGEKKKQQLGNLLKSSTLFFFSRLKSQQKILTRGTC